MSAPSRLTQQMTTLKLAEFIQHWVDEKAIVDAGERPDMTLDHVLALAIRLAPFVYEMQERR